MALKRRTTNDGKSVNKLSNEFVCVREKLVVVVDKLISKKSIRLLDLGGVNGHTNKHTLTYTDNTRPRKGKRRARKKQLLGK